MLTSYALSRPATARFRSDFDRIFEDFFGPRPFAALAPEWAGAAYPAVNIREDAENVQVEFELPGVPSGAFELTVVGNELTLKGHRAAEAREGAIYHRQERETGAFARTLQLPCEIDPDHVQATLKNGVLKITLPKARNAKPRKITVQKAG